VQDTFPALSDFVDNAIGVNVVNGLSSINSTICGTVDVRDVVS
jgi:hypothetical protein